MLLRPNDEEVNDKSGKLTWSELSLKLISMFQKSKHESKADIEPPVLKHYYWQSFSTKSIIKLNLTSHSYSNALSHLSASSRPTTLASAPFLASTRHSSSPLRVAAAAASLSTQASINELSGYRKNEFYSIFVSILTAAIFLLFIMWRWFRMKSDLRHALNEQQHHSQQSERRPSNSRNGFTQESSNLNFGLVATLYFYSWEILSNIKC